MPDNLTLTTVIDQSPLTPADKSHWVGLLPKLTEEQKEQLHHALVAKTQILKTISLIEKALKIIEDAEAEAEKEFEEEGQPLTPPSVPPMGTMPAQLPPLPGVQKEEMANLHQDIQSGDMPHDDLKDLHKESQDKLQSLRDELKNLSQEVQGTPPPSYTQS